MRAVFVGKLRAKSYDVITCMHVHRTSKLCNKQKAETKIERETEKDRERVLLPKTQSNPQYILTRIRANWPIYMQYYSSTYIQQCHIRIYQDGSLGEEKSFTPDITHSWV